MYLLVAGILWSMGAVSLVLTVVGLALRSWRLLWMAVLFSLVFTAAAALSIGPFVVLLVALQLASAVALRRSVHWRGWVMLLSTAVLIWILVVPFQLLVSRFLPFFFLVPLGLVAAIVATFAFPPSHAGHGATG